MENERKVGTLFFKFFLMLLQNTVLISHAIPMSIYVAIEVLKWFQVRLVLRDLDLFQDPGADKLASSYFTNQDNDSYN